MISPSRQRRDDVGHGTKAKITIKEIKISGMVLVPKSKMEEIPRKKKEMTNITTMADQSIAQDED